MMPWPMDMARRHSLNWASHTYDDKFFLYRGKGCDACNESGYKGRVGLHELLVATDEIKRLIQDGVMKSIQGLTDYKQIKAVAMK